jgi:hypothetical protein
MFTERDVVRAIAEHGAAGVNLKVSQLISVQKLVACSSTDTLEHVSFVLSILHLCRYYKRLFEMLGGPFILVQSEVRVA